MQAIINRFTSNPRQLFLIDGFGALLSVLFLFFFLATFETFFGMSSMIVYRLGTIAGLFMIYSFSCYFIAPKKPKPFVRIIALANLMYLILTFLLIIINFPQITVWGLLYFGIELVVLALLIYVEVQVSGKMMF